MRMFKNRFPGTLLLAVLYALGLAGIVASGGSGGSSNNDRDFSCDLEVYAIAAALDGSDDVWAGMLADTSDDGYHIVVRLDSSGQAQLRYTFEESAQKSLVRALAIATDALNMNDVYVGGNFERGILRLNDDGSLDPGFDTGDGFNGRVNSIVAADDGSGDIYVGGKFSEYDGTLVSGLVRLKSDGRLDNAGFAPAPVANVEGIALAPAGFIYSGSSTLPNSAALWRNNGVQDPDFTPAVAEVYAVATAASGNLYVGGKSATGVVRFTLPNGNNDGSFDGESFDSRVLSIVLAEDGTNDIYVAGKFSSYDNASANAIIRLAADGSRRNSFDIGSGFTQQSAGSDSAGAIETLARASDGTTDLYAGGRFTHYDGKRSNGIARVNDNGSLDRDFDVDISIDDNSCNDSSSSDAS